MKKAIEAKCKDCMCDWRDGKIDCQIPTCSLYYWQPYREMDAVLEWEKYYTKRKGLMLIVKRKLNAESLQKIRSQLTRKTKD